MYVHVRYVLYCTLRDADGADVHTLSATRVRGLE